MTTKPTVHSILKPEQQPKGKKILSKFSYSEMFTGPLPHPTLLQGYENACRGAASRIIKMAEEQSKHRQKLEDKVISSNINNERTGMFLSFVLTSGLAIIGAILIIFGKEIVGFISLFGPSFFHAGNYVYRKYIEKEEPRRKERGIEDAKKQKGGKRKKLRD